MSCSNNANSFPSENVINLKTYNFIPSMDAEGYDDESISRTMPILKGVDLEKAAVVLIDVVGSNRNSYHDNAVEFVNIARRQGMTILHYAHEFREIYGIYDGLYPFSENDIVINVDKIKAEEFLKSLGKEVNTLFMIGYGPAMCLMYSRQNSINAILQRRPDMDIVVVKDACYDIWANNHFEYRIATTTVSDFALATKEADKSVSITEEIPEAPSEDISVSLNTYYNSQIGINMDFTKTLLLLVNPMDSHPNDSFSARVQANNAELIELMNVFRHRNGHILYSQNQGSVKPSFIDPSVNSVYTIEDVRSFCDNNGITRIIYAGNLIHTNDIFTPMYVWSFSRRYFHDLEVSFIGDSMVFFEIPELYNKYNDDRFSRLRFLDRACKYTKARVIKYNDFMGNI